MPAAAANKDAQAKRLADRAIGEDYLATRFGDAVKKLQQALKLCGKDNCSPAVVARLHRDLGSVYITGQHKSGPGKKELEKALTADPAVELDPNLESPELRRAFDEVKAKLGVAEPAAEAEAEPAPELAEEEPEQKPAPAAAPSEPSAAKKNFISLSVEQDFMLFGSSAAVCPTVDASGAVTADPAYRCFIGDQYYDGEVYALSGNQIQGGIGIATTRVLLGYDRLVGDNILLGARLGYVFGSSPTAPDSGDFVPFHAEAKGSYYFGAKPFEASSLRPYAALGLGFAQIAARVDVQIYENEAGYIADQRFKIDAWRKAGNVFAAGGLGLELPIASSAIRVEGRFMQFFGTSASALALSAAYAFGL